MFYIISYLLTSFEVVSLFACNLRLVLTSERICLTDFVFETRQNFLSNFALFLSFFPCVKAAL
jgi:hypothetical protein